MVAAGIGGCTVEEAKERLSYYEVVRFWMPYMHKRGTLHQGMRLDRGFALLAYIIAHALGDKSSTMETFMPYADPKVTTPADVMNILMGGKR